MKKRLSLFSLLIAFLLIIPALSLAGQYRVIRVVDGDTIVVNYQGKYQKLRLLRVNTPACQPTPMRVRNLENAPA